MIAAASWSEAWRERLYVPAYRIGEAAHYARMAPQTVTAWHRMGAKQTLSSREGHAALSYLQLIEVAVVAAARNAGVSLRNIRLAREYMSREFGSKFPFAEHRFKTDGRNLFMEVDSAEASEPAGRVIRPDRGGQLAWSVIIGRLEEFDYDDIVLRWFVAGRNSPIVIDPRVAFGKPTLKGTPTWILRGRASEGESIADIADDFGLRAVPGSFDSG